MKKIIIGIIAVVCVCVIGLCFFMSRQNMIIGENLAKKATSIQGMMFEVMGLRFTQKEIDRFVKVIGPIEKWANANRDSWNAVNKAPNPLDAIRQLDVWKEVGMSADGFLTIYLKLKTAQDISSGRLSAQFLKDNIAKMKGLLNDDVLDEEDTRKNIEKAIEVYNKILSAIENYPASNLELYKKNKKKIDEVIVQFKSIDKKEQPEKK